MTVMLLVIGLLGVLWPVLVVLGGIGVVVWWVRRSAFRVDARERRERAELAALAARADEQHRLFFAGDPRGVYGIYPPT